MEKTVEEQKQIDLARKIAGTKGLSKDRRVRNAVGSRASSVSNKLGRSLTKEELDKIETRVHKNMYGTLFAVDELFITSAISFIIALVLGVV